MAKTNTTKTTAYQFIKGELLPKPYRIKSAYRSAVILSGYEPPHRIFSAEDTDTAKAQRLYTEYFKDAYNVLKYLNSKTPLPMLTDLLNGLTADRNHIYNGLTAMLEDDYKTTAEELRESADELNRIADSLLYDDEYRAIANTIAEDNRNQATANSTQAQATAKELTHSLSNSADLLQISAIADRQAPTEGDFKTAEKSLENLINRLEESTNRAEQSALVFINANPTAVLFSLAKQSHRRSAIRQYIRNQSSVNALDGTATSYKEATAEAVTKWINQYGDSYLDKQPTKGGYKSLVWKEPTKTQKGGYFFKYESKTYRQAHSFEALTTKTDNEGNSYFDESIITSSNIYIYNQTDLEQLQDLANCSNLTDRERLFINAFCSRSAIATESQARADYFTEYGKKATERGASERGFFSRRQYAFNRIGIMSDRTQRAVYNTIIEKLRTATDSTATADSTPHTIDFERLLKTNHGTRTAEDSNRKDLIKWTENERSTAELKAVKWVNISADLTDSERARAEQTAKAEELRRAYTSHILNGIAKHRTASAFKHLNASASAKVFLNSFSLEEIQTSAEHWQEMKANRPQNIGELKFNAEYTAKAYKKAVADLNNLLKWCTNAEQITAYIKAESQARAEANESRKVYNTALQYEKNLNY